jgi:F-box and leucine-rich repeat protein 14
MTQLRALQLGVCGGITGSDLMFLARLWQLTELDLFGCQDVAPSGLRALLCGLSKLQCLLLRNVSGPDISYVGQTMQLIGGLQYLRILSLDRVGHSLSNRSDADAMAERLFSLTELESLTLWGFNARILERRDWVPLQHLSRLRSLTISCRMTDEQLYNIAHLPYLETLELKSASCLSNLAMHAIAQATALLNVDLNECPHIDDQGVAYLEAHQGLLTFQLIGSSITNKSLKIMGTWGRLRNLSLAKSVQISDDGLKELCAATCLKLLDIAKCEQVTDDGLLLLAQLPQLRHLNIEGCANVSNLGVQQFKLRMLQACPVLQGTAMHRSSSSVVIFI